MNPINPEEIFTCQDLMEGNWFDDLLFTSYHLNVYITWSNYLWIIDYKICRKEKRF